MTAEQQKQVEQGIAQIHEIAKQIKAIIDADKNQFIAYTSYMIDGDTVNHQNTASASKGFVLFCKETGFCK